MKTLLSKINDFNKAKIYTALIVIFIISVYAEEYQQIMGGIWGIGLLKEIFKEGILLGLACLLMFCGAVFSIFFMVCFGFKVKHDMESTKYKY